MDLGRRQLFANLGSFATVLLAKKAVAAPATVKVAEFDAAGHKKGVVTVEKVVKTDAEWKKQLTREQYEVTRHEDTEPPGTGKYAKNHDKGSYRCICCGTALFHSDTKFESGTGWPSFYQPIASENIAT